MENQENLQPGENKSKLPEALSDQKLTQELTDIYKQSVESTLENSKADLLKLSEQIDNNTLLQTFRKYWNELPHAIQFLIYKHPANYLAVNPVPILNLVPTLIDYGFIDYKGHDSDEAYLNDIENKSTINNYLISLAEKLLKDPETQAFITLAKPIVTIQGEERKKWCQTIKTHLSSKRAGQNSLGSNQLN